MLAALSSALQFTVRAGSLLAVGTLLVAGVFGSPLAAVGGAASSASARSASASEAVPLEQAAPSSASDTILVEQPGRSAQPPDAQSAEVVVPVAAAPSANPAAPETPASTTAPLTPAPTTDPTAPVVAGETTPSSPARGSTANAAHPAGSSASSPAAVPDTCPADWFCYPRLGVAGPIVPYSDCSGSSDIRGAIVSFTCLSSRSSTYLIGHAYTQFGNITRWAAGDIVQANGVRYTVTGAITDRSCAAPSLPLARLSMQTSLGPSTCGPVLVVQAR